MQRRRLIFSLILGSAVLATLVLAVVFGPKVASGAPTSIDVRITAGSDDAEERPDGTISTGSSDLELVEDSSQGIQIVGVRFSRVFIPPSATVADAYVQFQVDETRSEETSLTIAGQDSDSAGTFTSSDFNLSTRPTTTVAVSWFPPPWTIMGEAGSDQRTPDLSNIVQEIVDRPGWEYGSSLAFIITGSGARIAESYDGIPEAAPMLHVEHSGGATPTATHTPTPLPPGINYQFAVIGDYGDDSSDEGRVAALVNSWDPDFVITAGDNNYPDGDATTIDQNIGKHYGQYIGSYQGSYGSGSVTNRFWPSLGNHDWNTIVCDAVGCSGAYMDYFTLPGNERYYEVDYGLVRLYAIDTDNREPDGDEATSVQGTWLQNALAASSSCFNVVYFHHPPYSSGDHGSVSDSQWPFAEWGADVIVSGHDHSYERLDVGGVPYFVNGAGGKSLRDFPNLGTLPPEATSIVRYDGDYGAMLVVVTETGMHLQFFNTNNTLIDDYLISKECSVGPTPTPSDTPLPTLTSTPTSTPTPGPSPTPTDTPTATPTTLAVEVSITDANDDAEEDVSSGNVSLGSSDLELGEEIGGQGTVTQIVGMRFNSMVIPQGATVLSATIQFQADETGSLATSLSFQAEAIDNAPIFSNTSGDLTSRTKTSAAVAWSPSPWSTAGEAGPAQRTSDLSPIIQEVIDRPGWSSGSSLAVIVTGSGERVAESYNGDPSGAPRLYVEFDVGGPSPTITSTPTPTDTPSPSSTSTPTLTPTPLPTDTPTPVPTDTPTPFPTTTPTPTSILTPTFTPTPLATDTPTPVPTDTPTPLLTYTPTPVLTATPTPVPTETPTPSPTDTPMPSPTNTPTPVPTDTPTPSPTDTPTPLPTDTPTPLPTDTPTPAATPGPGDTGWLSPTTNMAESSGDGDGFETNAVNAHADDTFLAIDANSGTNKANSCSSDRKDGHRFYGYDIVLPPGAPATGIEVQIEALVDSTAGSPFMCIQLSWDGGANWTAPQSTLSLVTVENTFILGSSSDLWERTWSNDELTNANFRVRVINVARSTDQIFSLDWIGIRVYYQSSGPTPTPTSTPSVTLTPTETKTPIPTQTNTPGPSPTNTWTPMPSDTPTVTATPTVTPTPSATSTPGNTGWMSPATNMAEPSGDGDGFELNSVGAHADDAFMALDANSGTKKANNCSSEKKDSHRFYDYGISLPGGITIAGIEVRLDALVDSVAGSPTMCAQLSWDGGTTWTSPKLTPGLGTDENTFILGGPNDTWGRTWTADELSNANFRVRVINVANSTEREFSLDWLAVKISYR